MAGAWIAGQSENILMVTDMAKRLTYMLMPAFLFATAAIFVRTSIQMRMFVLLLILLQMLFVLGNRLAAESTDIEVLRQKALYKAFDKLFFGANYAWYFLLAILLLGDLAVRFCLHTTLLSDIQVAAPSVWSFLMSKDILAVILRAVVAFVAAFLLIRLADRLIGPDGIVRVVAWLLVITLAIFPWVNDWIGPEKETAAVTATIVWPTVDPDPAPAPVRPAATHAHQGGVRHIGKVKRMNLSPEGQAALDSSH